MLSLALMKPFRFLLFFVLSLLGFCYLSAAAQCPPDEIMNLRKTAIIFGEKDYKHCPSLANPGNDAMDMRDSLKRLGFSVLTYIDADLPSMENAITHWCADLDNYDVALFYFSGHGAEVKGDNYLFPVDINALGPSDLNRMAYSVDKLVEAFGNSHLKYSVIILDACRNNPFSKGWSRGIGEGGLAQMAGKGTFIAFAATPGQTASDGINRNGIYTEAILKNIMVPNRSVNDIFTNVNGYVRTVTKGEQQPFFNSSMGRLYCFSVTRPFKPIKKAKQAENYRISSSIAVSPDEDVIFTVNKSKNEIGLHDIKTMNLIRTLIGVPGHPIAVIPMGVTDLIAIDSTSHSVIQINWQYDKVVKQYPMTMTPIEAIISPDQKKLYVFGNDQRQGYLTTIDLVHGKIVSTRQFDGRLIHVTCDDHAFYALLKEDVKKISIINIRSGEIKKISVSFDAVSLSISPDDRQLYVMRKSGDYVVRLNLTDLKLKDTLSLSALAVYFSGDSRYAFAENNEQVILFRTADGDIMKKNSFYYPPNGVVTDNANVVYIWLPGEDRVFSFHLEEQLKDSASGLDPDAKLKNFQTWIKSDPTLKNRVEQRKHCDQLHLYAESFLPTFGLSSY